MTALIVELMPPMRVDAGMIVVVVAPRRGAFFQGGVGAKRGSGKFLLAGSFLELADQTNQKLHRSRTMINCRHCSNLSFLTYL